MYKILHLHYMENTFHLCITLAPTSFLLSAPSLRRTCGVYLGGCVSQTLLILMNSDLLLAHTVASLKDTACVCVCVC